MKKLILALGFMSAQAFANSSFVEQVKCSALENTPLLTKSFSIFVNSKDVGSAENVSGFVIYEIKNSARIIYGRQIIPASDILLGASLPHAFTTSFEFDGARVVLSGDLSSDSLQVLGVKSGEAVLTYSDGRVTSLSCREITR